MHVYSCKAGGVTFLDEDLLEQLDEEERREEADRSKPPRGATFSSLSASMLVQSIA